ncbi:TonB-dependent receptor [Wenyingzhuangia sp. IMCC45574]
MKTKLLSSLFFLICLNFYGQNTTVIKGKVLNSKDNTPVITATVSVANSPEIAVVDEKGNFTLELKKAPPVEIHVNAIGFKHYKHKITVANSSMRIHLDEDVTSLDQVVLSASRTPERVFESPVTIERIGAKQVETTTSANFYDGLENLKGVDVNSSSLTFKSVNTRGFATFANSRFVQLVDGVDNASPGLNFALGNLVGLNDLDVGSVELLPGAASALYGANAFNGIMLMRSKNPFTNPGSSVYGKIGFTDSDNGGVNHFIDAGFRVAKKINEKVAIKFTGSLFRGTDWVASDSRNINSVSGEVLSGTRENTFNYNGINVYGDEFTNPDDLGFGKVTRTGYNERDLVDYTADSFKADIALHFRPIEGDSDTEIILGSKYGTGNAIYQGASRYALRNFVMHQHKLEFRTKNLMIRSYVSIEDAGDSYDIRFAGINTLRSANNAVNGYNALNNTSLSVDELWFGTYGAAYGAALGGGATQAQARVAARTAADTNFRTDPNSEEFRSIFNTVISNPDFKTGAKFVDSSRLYHSDFNYNFKDQIEFAEIQVGGSARRYVLNSEGTIYTDADGSISYDEFGIYTQMQKKLVDDRLKLTGSIRYDKAQNFDGNFSPRFSVSFSPDEDKKHNIRASIQTGFRNPTTQEQYIGLDLGNTRLLGSAPDNLDRYTANISNSASGQALGFGASTQFTGQRAYSEAFTVTSAQAFSTLAGEGNIPGAIGALVKADVDLIKPEKVLSFEVGYRGKMAEKTVLDFSAYYNKYTDFINIINVIVPNYGNTNLSDVGTPVPGVVTPLPNAVWALINGDSQVTSLYTNTKADVASYGVNVGLETTIGDGYDIGINYAFAKQEFDQEDDPNFETGFNTPEHKVKASFGNNDVYNGFGFGLNVRWQDKYYWQSSFVDGAIDARTLVDAQVMYNIEKWNSKIKIGGANILGHNYFVAPGTGMIGSQYYGSWIYNF